MSVQFSFSFGVLVAGIQQVTNALEDSAAEFRVLITELYSLERALLEVKHLDLDTSQNQESAVYRFGASSYTVPGDCQRLLK